MTTQTTLTYTLEEFLTKFELRIDRQFAEVNQKMDKQFAEVNQRMDKQFAEVNQKMDKQFAEVNQKFVEVNQKFAEVNQTLIDVKIGQADLSAKVDGIDKRLSNQEFFNRSFLLAVIASLLGIAAKLFGVLPIDK
jgi:DNA anti-recombination protein RmuC